MTPFVCSFSDEPLILHRLTPKLDSENGQVGPSLDPDSSGKNLRNFGTSSNNSSGGLLIHPVLFVLTQIHLLKVHQRYLLAAELSVGKK